MPTLVDLLFNTVDGVFAVDAKQRIIYWNSACEQLLGVSREWAMGRPCFSVVKGGDPSGDCFCGPECCVSQLAQQGSGAPKIFPLVVRDAQRNAVRFSVSIVLVPSQCKDRWTVVHLLHRGAVGDTLDLMDRSVARSRHRRHKESADTPEPVLPDAVLTSRQEQILRLLAEGLQASVIAERLRIELVTVRNHIQHIQSKLGVHSQVEAVAFAYRHNMV